MKTNSARNGALKLRRGALVALCAGAVIGAQLGVAHARLPPPSEQDRALSEQKAALAQEQLEQEKQALARAQDRVSERYKQEHGGPPSTPTPPTSEKNIPKTVIELPGQAGPTGGSKQSAEAHSASVR